MAHGTTRATGHGPDSTRQLMAMNHGMAAWTQYVNGMLGIWLIASPLTLGYRSQALAWSDVVSGAALLLLLVWARLPSGAPAAWLSAAVGIWLLFAPLVFWAPTAAEYLNDTLIGALIIAFAVIIPHSMPMQGPDVPPGWTYNPSTWMQRAPIVVLSLVSFAAARYMAAFQLGHVPAVWDPLFGDGTERVLTSAVSKAWPISDAGLGALFYLTEALMSLMGDPRRWRTMPWMVVLTFIAVVPLGVVSIVLIILQPVAVGAFCTLCLGIAFLMLLMIPLQIDEFVASAQFLSESVRRGQGFWSTLFLGGDSLPGGRESKLERLEQESLGATLRGQTFPPALLLVAALGIWLMFSPLALGTTGGTAAAAFILGPLVTTVAITALSEVARAARLVNLALGLAVVIAPFVLAGTSDLAPLINGIFVGTATILLSLPRGKVSGRYGGLEHLAA